MLRYYHGGAPWDSSPQWLLLTTDFPCHAAPDAWFSRIGRQGEAAEPLSDQLRKEQPETSRATKHDHPLRRRQRRREEASRMRMRGVTY